MHSARPNRKHSKPITAPSCIVLEVNITLGCFESVVESKENVIDLKAFFALYVRIVHYVLLNGA